MRKLDWIAFAAAAGLAALVLFAGCRPAAEKTASQAAPPSPEDTLAEREAELREREAAVAQREAAVASREEPVAPSGDDFLRPEPSLLPSRVEAPRVTRPAPAPQPAAQPEPERLPEPQPPAEWEPLPEPEPEARMVTVLVPAGTTFDVEFADSLSSETSQIGETFEARAVSDLMVGSGVAVPAGSTIVGRVTDVRAGRRIGGSSLLALAFDELRLPGGESFPLQATFAAEGRSDRKRDAATIGGSAAGGAVLGHVLKDSDKGTAIGAILGAAIGAGIAARTPGQPVEIPAGTVVALTLSEELTVRRQMSG